MFVNEERWESYEVGIVTPVCRPSQGIFRLDWGLSSFGDLNYTLRVHMF